MANKRSSHRMEAAPSRPSKKRKSAEASKLKMKEIAEAEMLDDAEIFPEVKEKLVIEAKKVTEEVEEVPHVVAPGFRVWNTTSKMTAGGELSEGGSQFDMALQKHSVLLDIHSDEPFSIKPLVITQGPYKGSRVFMLESGAKFRFAEFPAEIRNLVYSFLVEEDEPINMSTDKVVNEPRRPVRLGFRDFSKHQGLKRDPTTGKWLDQPPSSFMILRSSKNVFKEVAPLMYGTNRFVFDDLGDLKTFLDRVNSMRKYIRHIEIGPYGFFSSKARTVFASLRECSALRTLAFHYSCFRNDGTDLYMHYRAITTQGLVSRARMMLDVRRAYRGADDGFNVLDLIQVVWHRCTVCEPLAPEFASEADCRGSNRGYIGTSVKCKDAAAHCEEVSAKIRTAVAKMLHIEE